MGGSKKQTIGYKYYLGIHMILCHGPIDSITKISIDKKTAWLGYSTGGQITINKPSLFGGDEKEGGISGTLDIEMGGPSQVQNSYLTSVLGAIIPAYRKVAGVVLRKMYLGTSPYPKPWSFRGTRILKAQDGTTQWYPSKASINVDPPVDPVLVDQNDPWEIAYSTILEYTNPPSTPKNTGYSAPVAGPFSRSTNLAASYGYWIRKTITVDNESIIRIAGDVENSCAVYLDNAKVLDTNPTNAQVLGDTFSVDRVVAAGSHTIHIYFRDERPIEIDNANISVSVEQVSTIQVDMNPAHAIRECLTNSDWGMGYPAGDIDDTVFQAVADVLYDEKLGISFVWDRSMDIEKFMEEILRHIDASLFVSRRTGKWNIKLVRKDYDVGSLITFDKTNVSSVSNPNRVAFGELSNSVTVKYWNYKTGTDDSVTVSDTALAKIQQDQLISATVNYPCFTNKRNAVIAAQRDLRALSSGYFSCTLIANSDAEDLNIGSPFIFNWPEWQIYNMVMRVTGISFGDGINNKIRITASEDIYATSTTAQIVVDSGTGWVDPSQPPGSISEQVAFEVPYFEAVQNYGQTNVDDALEGNPDAGYVISAASRPDGAINARMWTDAGSGYTEAAMLDFCPFGVLTEEIDPDQTTFILSNFSDLDEVELGSYAMIGEEETAEFIRIDTIDTSTGEVVCGRGCLDTTPKRHFAGVNVFFLDVFSAADQTEYNSGETISVKLTSITGQGQFDVDSATPMEVVLSRRAFRPYPPGQFQINSIYYPSDDPPLSGTLTMSWVGRDRVQQTSGEIYDHTFGNIGPEAGTTYRIQGYIDGVLVHTNEPVTTGETWAPSGEGLVKVEIHSKRDGYYSFQPAFHEFLYTNTEVLASEEGDITRASEDSDNIRLMED